jgi:hypothetical protein
LAPKLRSHETPMETWVALDRDLALETRLQDEALRKIEIGAYRYLARNFAAVADVNGGLDVEVAGRKALEADDGVRAHVVTQTSVSEIR